MVAEAQHCQVFPRSGRFDANGRKQVGREIYVIVHSNGSLQPLFVVSRCYENQPLWVFEILSGRIGRTSGAFICLSNFHSFRVFPTCTYWLPSDNIRYQCCCKTRAEQVYPFSFKIKWWSTQMKGKPAVDSNKNWLLAWTQFGQRKGFLQCFLGIIHIFHLCKF